MEIFQPIIDLSCGIIIGIISKWYYDNFVYKKYNTLDEIEGRLKYNL